MEIISNTNHKISKSALWTIILSVLVFVIIGYLGFSFLRTKALHEEQKKVASQIADEFNSYVEDNFALISNISSHYEFKAFVESDFGHDNQEKVLHLLDLVDYIHEVSIVYMLDRQGTTTASTEYEEGKRLVGNNYSFRPYFTNAISGANSVYGAVGVTTYEKGIYFSSPVYKEDNSIGGVLVIKTEVAVLDSILKDIDNPVLILTDSKVVFYSNKDEFIYKTSKDYEESKLLKVNLSKQFADINVSRADISFHDEVVNYKSKKYFIKKEDVPLAGWQVVTLWDANSKYPFYNINSKLIFTIMILFWVLIVLLVVNFVNNKKRKRAEINLIESEQRYRDLTETLPQSVFETDSSRKLIYANKTTFDTFKINSTAIQNRLIIDSLIEGSNRDKITNELDKFTSDREHDILIIESKLIKTDGEGFSAALYVKRLYHGGCFSGFRMVVVDITHIKLVEDQLKKTLKEKEFLLREIHHRVKNNLQIISSLLHLQSNKMKDPDVINAINESRSRIKTMALIHQQLYQSMTIERINTGEYIKALVKNLVHTYSCNAANITIDYEIDDTNLTIDKAIPCGLIINELISNALKYAFIGRKDGLLQINLKEVGDKTVLTVSDDGNGLPQKYDFTESATLGIKLVQTLAEQLGGDVEFKKENGVKCIISF